MQLQRHDTADPENSRPFPPEEPHGGAEKRKRSRVEKFLRSADALRHAGVINQGGGHIAVAVAEKHIVRCRPQRQEREYQAEDLPPAIFRQQVKDDAPHHESAGGQEERVQDVNQGRAESVDFHKLLRGIVNHRGRNQHPSQQREKHCFEKI